MARSRVAAPPLLAAAACVVAATATRDALPFVLVSDLDRASRVQDGGRPAWRATLLHGELERLPPPGVDEAGTGQCDPGSARYRVRLGREEELFSRHSYRERGMELSDLAQFGADRELWSVCDSTGLLYRLRGVSVSGSDDDAPPTALPQRVLLDDDGNSSLPCKSEWMGVKDGSLYVGGHGKEWVSAGVVRGRGAEWVRVLGADGSVRYEDWHERYGKLRAATDTSFPGYLSHEAVDWDGAQRRWIMVPRKAQASSVEGGYDDTVDELRGTNLLLSVSEDFSAIQQVTLGAVDPAWGASGIRLLPVAEGSTSTVDGACTAAASRQARHVLVLRSSEQGGHAESSLGVFSVDDGLSLLASDAGGQAAGEAGTEAMWVSVGPRKYEGVALLPP